MSGELIYRYNAVSEYADLISTKPSRERERRGISQRGIHPMNISVSSTGAPTERMTGRLPPLEDVKAVLRRIQSAGNISQSSVFSTLAPLLTFFALLATGMVALQPHSFAYYVVSAPREHSHDLLKGLLLVLGGLSSGLVVLRALIWIIAICLEMLLEVKERAPQVATGYDEEDGVPIPSSTSALVSGIFQ